MIPLSKLSPESSSSKRERKPPKAEAGPAPSSPEEMMLEMDELVEISESEADRLLKGFEKDAEGLAPEELAQARTELEKNGEGMRELALNAKLDLIDAMPHADGKRMKLMTDVCMEEPRAAVFMERLGFSAAERLSIAFRVAKESPSGFLRMLETGAVSFAEDEKIALAIAYAEDSPDAFAAAVKLLKLSSDGVAEALRAAGPQKRDLLLTALDIPGRQAEPAYKDFTEQELAWFKQGDMMDDPKRMALELRLEKTVEAARRAEAELLLAIEAAYPDRIERERERLEIERGLRGKIETMDELAKTMAAPLIVTIEGRELPAVYKAREREKGLEDPGDPAKRARSGIEPGTGPAREWLAYQIDKALQFDLVPVTVLREGPKGFGAFQDFKVGQDLTDDSWITRAQTDPKLRYELARVGFFDAAVNNSDRHAANWLMGPDGQANGIDHGNIFNRQVNTDDKLRSWPLWAVAGDAVPQPIVEKVERFRGAKEVQAALRKAFEVALGDEAEAAWSGFVSSIDGMMKDGLPESQWKSDNEMNYREMYV